MEAQNRNLVNSDLLNTAKYIPIQVAVFLEGYPLNTSEVEQARVSKKSP